jgi:hypothetical protein
VEKILLLNLMLFSRSSFFSFSWFSPSVLLVFGNFLFYQNTAQHHFLAKHSFFTWRFGGVNLESVAVSYFLALLTNQFACEPMSSSTIFLCRT